MFSRQIKKKLVIKLDLQNITGTHTKKLCFPSKNQVQASTTMPSLAWASPSGALSWASLAGALSVASVSVAED